MFVLTRWQILHVTFDFVHFLGNVWRVELGGENPETISALLLLLPMDTFTTSEFYCESTLRKRRRNSTDNLKR